MMQQRCVPFAIGLKSFSLKVISGDVVRRLSIPDLKWWDDSHVKVEALISGCDEADAEMAGWSVADKVAEALGDLASGTGLQVTFLSSTSDKVHRRHFEIAAIS